MREVLHRVGRYEILGELGRGAMGVVYLARQTDLGRLVALKELGKLGAGDPRFVQRFVQESRLAGSLTHPNIVTVHDYFEHDGLPYISMELAERGSLRSWMDDLTLAQTAGVLEGVLAGLAHAAQRAIVHRDIKPENIVVTGDRLVKIADFGIGKALDRLSNMTMTVGPIGTPAYIAPEQVRGDELGPATDLYAVGVMAHEMLVGRLPAPALRRLIDDPGVSLRAGDPTLDGGLAATVERMLAIDPSQRHDDPAHAWAELEEHVTRLLGSLWRRDARLPDTGPRLTLPDPSTNAALDSRPGAPARRPRARTSREEPGVARATTRRGRKRWLAAVAVAAAAVAIGTAVLPGAAPQPRSSGVLSVKAGPEGCISATGTDGRCATAPGMWGAHQITISPDGRNAYVASDYVSALVSFARDERSGVLRPLAGSARCFARDGADGACASLQSLGGAESVAVSPDGRSVYVASLKSSALAVFDRNAGTGTLRPHAGEAHCFGAKSDGCAPAQALGGANAVVVSPDGRNVYVASYHSHAVAIFDRDPSSGGLRQKPGQAGCASDKRGPCARATAMDGPESVTISPDGRNLYVGAGESEAVAVFDRDRSGALTQKRDQAGCLSSHGNQGDCALAPALAIGDAPNPLAFSPDGATVYVASEGTGVVVVLARDGRGGLTATPGLQGCVSETGSDGRCARAAGLGDGSSAIVSPDGRSVYVALHNRDAVAVFDRDDRSGALRLRPGRAGCVSRTGRAGRCVRARALDGASSLALSPDAKNVYVASIEGHGVTVFDRR